MRLHEASKKYNLETEDLLQLLRRAGFEVSSHMSGLTYDMIETVEKFTHPRRGKVKAKRKTATKKATTKKATAKKTTTTKAKTKTKVKVKTKGKVKVKVKTKTKAKAKKKAAAVEEIPEAPKVVIVKKRPPKPAEEPKKVEAKPEPVEEPKAVEKKPEEAAKPKTVERRRAILGDETPTPRLISKAPAPEPPKPKPKPADKPQAKPAAQPSKGDKRAHKQGQRPAEAKPAEAPARKPAATARDAQQRAVRESVRRTLARMETTRKTKRRKPKASEDGETAAPALKVTEGSTVRELAHSLKVEPTDLIKACMELGVPATINQALDKDIIELIAEDLELDIQFVSDEIEELIKVEAHVDPLRLEKRAPVVTVMGHVDHGKTSILDYIRKTRVASGEAGGITQHIGAYRVETPNGDIAFIDTPGHEAFTSMRSRGAQITDIVVLVVAADDGVMPQTIEAINHARAADVPLIVAVNKCDLVGAQPAQIKQQLTEHNVIVEDFGGEVVSTEVSAKTGEGIDKLLEMILLQAEVLELKADKEATPQAVAVEVKKEEGRGILVTVLVKQGTLHVGDGFVIGSQYGKVRAMLDHRGKVIKEAGPSMPVVVLGANELPEAGDSLTVVDSEKDARELAEKRQQLSRDREQKSTKKLSLEELYSQIQEGAVKELRIVIKGDTDGSVEAVKESLTKLSLDEVTIKVIHAAVGAVSESDVLLASSSNAVIIGFAVKVPAKVAELAEREKIDVKTYSIIYEAIEDVDAALRGMLEPVRVEVIQGRAEVRKVFKISRLGQIAGSFVLDGMIARSSQVRVIRADEIVHEGRISSLKRFQDDVKEVQKDFECGIGVADYNRLQEGDIIEAFVIEERARVVTR